MTADEIYKEIEHLVNKKFMDPRDGKVYTFIGVIICPDDYYYGMYNREYGLVCLSCVGDIENSWCFTLVENDNE